MAVWKHKVDVSDINSKLCSDVIDANQAGIRIAERLEALMPKFQDDSSLEDIIGNFKYAEDEEELNITFADLLDWADWNFVWVEH
jgi:hypothetical protein